MSSSLTDLFRKCPRCEKAWELLDLLFREFESNMHCYDQIHLQVKDRDDKEIVNRTVGIKCTQCCGKRSVLTDNGKQLIAFLKDFLGSEQKTKDIPF